MVVFRNVLEEAKAHPKRGAESLDREHEATARAQPALPRRLADQAGAAAEEVEPFPLAPAAWGDPPTSQASKRITGILVARPGLPPTFGAPRIVGDPEAGCGCQARRRQLSTIRSAVREMAVRSGTERYNSRARRQNRPICSQLRCHSAIAIVAPIRRSGR